MKPTISIQMMRWGLCLMLLLVCRSGRAFPQADTKPAAQPNYDALLAESEKAFNKDPRNPKYRLRVMQVRFEASQFHVSRGLKLLEEQKNDQALKEFETALAIDPSSTVARQEIDSTRRLLASPPAPHEQPSPEPGKPKAAAAESLLMDTPPGLAPLSREPVTLKMNADSKMVFRTLGKLAGLNVIFDPDFQEKKINVDLVNVTIQQAMNAASVEAKAFWKPIATNIILVMPDSQQKRKEQEEQILEKIYLQHTQTAQELTEIMNSIQQMLELRHVQALPRDNAILIRDTPAKVLLASRLIRDSDRGRPEVVVQISVLQVRRDRARSLGIQPGSSTSVTFNPATPLGPAGAVALSKLNQLSQGDFALTIPSAVASALFSDSNTRIIQNPQVRVSDGESARLRVGDRVPIATGSFQAIGVGPSINTQFQYIDVGVNIDLTPHVHPDHSVSIKLGVEVSSLNGKVNIGGIDQPIISQRRIEHEIRLQEGELSVLGGLAERSQTKSVTGWPGLSRLPLLRYLFSGEDTSNSENEVLIVINPRQVRMRDLAGDTLHALSVGTDSEITLRSRDEFLLPVAAAAQKPGVPGPAEAVVPGLEKQLQTGAVLQLDPQKVAVKPGEITLVQVRMEDVEDLFSASLLLRYDPQVLSLDDVRHGDFLSGGGSQEVAILQRIDHEKGEASIYTTRQPNTAGVNGQGVLLNLVIRHLTDAPATLQVIEVGARSSRQRPIPVTITQGVTNFQ